ncbi:DUF4157 domain-containing protein [uncultured Roseobacter sp.]|uniref:eCIS core domain-containing protein n=1 Tax=uncultured Roseobacter sp. TaxID=114847 RepID=UPI00345C7963
MRIPYASIWPIIERYKNHLYNSADGRWKRLPSDLVRDAQRYYPEIDLANVSYAENIDTLHGQAITWHYNIFFPRRIDLRRAADLEWMLHELEHTVQYERRGGEQKFLSEYVMKAPGKVLERRNFNVHDYIDIERAAIVKGERVFEALTGEPARASNRGNFASQSPSRNAGPQGGQSNARQNFTQRPQAARICSTPFGSCPLMFGPPMVRGSQCWCSNGFSTAYGVAQ